MTITAADIKIGMCIEMDGKTFLVVDFQHCKPGKGPAFVRSKLKNLENGRVLENTFSSVGQKIEQVRVERRPYQFTYEDDLGAHFMHTETFEEINIEKSLLPSDLKNNKGHNVFYCLPLILGLIGLFWQAYKVRRITAPNGEEIEEPVGIQQFWIVFFRYYYTIIFKILQ